MIASFFQSVNFLSSLDFVRVYKATWQAAGTDYLAYARTIFSSDPYLAILALLRISFLITQKGKSKAKLWYIALATIPLMTFIALHRGQIESPGIMFRYMGLFTFLLYLYVIVKSPRLKQILEQRLALPPIDSINNSAFFPVLKSANEDSRQSGICPPN